MTWDLCVGFIYLMCYFIDPFVLAFQFRPLLSIDTNRIQRALTFILFFNMALIPFSALEKKNTIFNEIEESNR